MTMIQISEKIKIYRQQNTLMSNYIEKMSLVPDDWNGEFFKLSYYSYRGGKKLHQICSATCIY